MIRWLIARATAVVLPRLFDPRRAGDLRVELEFRVRPFGRRAPVPVAVSIADGACTARPGPAASPAAVATFALDDLARLLTRAVGWPELLSSGRLEMTGDPFLALRLPLLFRMPVGSPGGQAPTEPVGAGGILDRRLQAR